MIKYKKNPSYQPRNVSMPQANILSQQNTSTSSPSYSGNLDSGVMNLALAIRQHESGGNYDAKGGSGEGGAYQFMPSTWKSWAGKYLGDSNAEMNKINQNKVAYNKIKELKDQGLNPKQIAATWNSGGPDWEGKVGTNKYGVHYDVPKYVNSVYSLYQQNKEKNKKQFVAPNFWSNVDALRKGGKSDTDILDSLKEKYPSKYGGIIDASRKTYSAEGTKINNDRDLLNEMSKRASNKMPTEKSTPIIPSVKDTPLGMADYKLLIERKTGQTLTEQQAKDGWQKYYDSVLDTKRAADLVERKKVYDEAIKKTPLGYAVKGIRKGMDLTGEVMDWTGLPLLAEVLVGEAGNMAGAAGAFSTSAVNEINKFLTGENLYNNEGSKKATYSKDTIGSSPMMVEGDDAKASYTKPFQDAIDFYASGEGKEFGGDIGRTGVETAPLMAAGKYLDMVMAAPLLYDAANSYNKGDYNRASAELLVASLAFVGDVKSRGKYLDPHFSEGLANVFKGKVLNNIGDKAGDILQKELEKTADKYIYRTPSMMKNEARWNKNTPKFLAEEGIIKDMQIEGGKINTKKMIETLDDKYEIENRLVRTLLEDSNEYVDVEQLRNVKKNLADNFKSKGSDYDKAVKYIDNEIDALLKNYSDDLIIGSNGEKLLPLEFFNDVKSSFWKKSSVNKFTREALLNDLDFQLGHEAKDIIEKQLKGKIDIGDLNSRLGDYASARRVLEQADNRKVPGNFFRGKFASMLGGMAAVGGGANPVTIMASGITADYLSKMMAESGSVKIGVIDSLLKKLNKTDDGKKVISEAFDILEKNKLERIRIKKLGGPTAVYGKEYKGGKSGVIDAIEVTDDQMKKARKAVGLDEPVTKELPAPKGTETNPFIVDKKGRVNPKMAQPLMGVFVGVQVDENGNVTIDPTMAALGIGGMLLSKKLSAMKLDDLVKIRKMNLSPVEGAMKKESFSLIEKFQKTVKKILDGDISSKEGKKILSKIDEQWKAIKNDQRGSMKNPLNKKDFDLNELKDNEIETLEKFLTHLKEQGNTPDDIIYMSDSFKKNNKIVKKISQEKIKQKIDKNGYVKIYRVSEKMPTKETVGWSTEKQVVKDWADDVDNPLIFEAKIKPENIEYWDGILSEGTINNIKEKGIPTGNIEYGFQDQEILADSFSSIKNINQINKPKPYKNISDYTTKTLNKLEGKTTVNKQFIQDLTKSPELKKPEKELINKILDEMPEGKVNVQEFSNRVEAELLPLERKTTDYGQDKYEGVVLPKDIKGDVENYSQHVYESPAKNSAGNVHFDKFENPNYFAHTRVEDMADGKTRRVIEVQSDLMNKGRLKNEMQKAIGIEDLMTEGQTQRAIESELEASKEFGGPNKKYKELNKLKAYENKNIWLPRITREEIKQAAKDGKKVVQFPTGKTAMKIEGLGDRNTWGLISEDNIPMPIKTEDLKVGAEVGRSNLPMSDRWIITDVMGDGEFKALPKSKYEEAFQAGGGGMNRLYDSNRGIRIKDFEESFDISGKVDTNHGTYKTYEKDLQKFLKKEYPEMKQITDKQGVEWFEIPIKKEWATNPINDFGISTPAAMLGIAAAITGGAYVYNKAKDKVGDLIEYGNKHSRPPGYVSKEDYMDEKKAEGKTIEEATKELQEAKPEKMPEETEKEIVKKIEPEKKKSGKPSRIITDGTSNLYNFEVKPKQHFNSIIYNGKKQNLEEGQLDVANYVYNRMIEKGFKWPAYGLKLLYGESSYGLLGDNDQGNWPENSKDLGIYQFNSHWHPEMIDKAYDIDASIDRMMEMVNNGQQGEWIADKGARKSKIKLLLSKDTILNQG